MTDRAGGSRLERLGWLPGISVATALGLLVVAIADTRARFGDDNAPLILWLGLLIIVAPTALRVIMTEPSRAERLGLVLLLGCALYLVKVLHDPTMFTLYDEFLHVRTTEDILLTGRLFTPNPVLLASPYYPGLESTTSALTMLSGGHLFQAGVILVGAARVVLVIALFLLIELASRSARLAGIAVLVYATNPSFLFFSAQFAYESLALPFAVLSLYVILRRYRDIDHTSVSWMLILILVSATIVTHHISSLGLSVVLFAWALVHFVRRKHTERAIGPLKPAVFTMVATLIWLYLVANATVAYLEGPVAKAVSDVLGLLSGTSGPRQLFEVTIPPPDPAWERGLAFASVGIIMVALPVGLWQLRKKGYLRNSLILTLGLGSLLYPATQIARLTEWAAEVAARATTFLFLAVSLVVGVAVVWGTATRVPSNIRRAALTGAIVVLFMGGVVIAVPPWARVPGPYLMGADQRSVEPEGITAAEWSREFLGTENRFMADRTNSLLLATYGGQHPVTVAGDNLNVYAAFFSTTLDAGAIQALRAGQVRYVIIDRRLSTGLPRVGVYTERGEALGGARTVPISAEALAKFDGVGGVSRIFDSGDIQIYDVGTLSGVADAGL